jgi:hypothetical protein
MIDTENVYIILVCGVVIVLVLHTMNKNKKLNLYLGENNTNTKNLFTDQIKINLQGYSELTRNKADVSETHQVILHKYIYEKLQEIANEDYGIKTLTGPYEIKTYNRLTITKDMKEFIKLYILHPILTKLSKCTNMNFKDTNIERVIQKISKDGANCLYLIDVFIYDKANFFEKKIAIDIHHDLYMDYYHLNTINFSLNDYLCNEIYKPRDTLTDMHHNVNSNLVVDITTRPCNTNKNTMHLPGEDKTKLDHVKLNPLNNYNSITQKSQQYNQIALPSKMCELYKHHMPAWPCGETELAWDENGVLIPKDMKNTCGKDGICLGNYDPTYQGEPLDTYFHPSNFETRK